MNNSNSNMLLVLFIVIIVIAIVYYLNKNDGSPIHNTGVVNEAHMASGVVKNGMGSTMNNISSNNGGKAKATMSPNARAVNPHTLSTRDADDLSEYVVDDLIAQYSVDDIPQDDHYGSFVGSESDGKHKSKGNNYGSFKGYGKKRQINMKKMEMPYSDDEYDCRDFSYKKNKYSKRTPDDIKDLFNLEAMLPQEDEGWFDTVPINNTKKIRGTHLIHPKIHMGTNTVGSSRKNGTHDIRGDIPNPKISVAPWNNSTIEPDPNARGLCNPI